MKTSSQSFLRALPALVLFLAASASHAGSIQITPVRVNLSEGAKVAVLTVRNTGTETSLMQVTLNKWTLEGQENAYKQSQELVITPVTFRLAPGKQQIVRIGLRGKVPAAQEAAYRLLVEEVPPPRTASDQMQTRLVVRHDLPVFVAPAVAAKPSLDIAMECATGGNRLLVTNIGNVHQQLRNLTLEGSPTRDALGRWDTNDYLLPDARKSWVLAKAAPAAAGKNFVVTALTDQGSFSADVKNTCT